MKKAIIEPHKSSLGMNANLATLLIFIGMGVVSWIPYLGWIAWAVPLAFFFMEKESKFVKFQAVTALVLGVIWSAISIVLKIFVWALTPKDLYSAVGYLTGRSWGAWVLLGTISTILGVIMTAIIVYLTVMAYGYKQVELPVIGPIAAKASEKLDSLNININPMGSNTECKTESEAQNVSEEHI
jgi:uncharacterized membrane protein